MTHVIGLLVLILTTPVTASTPRIRADELFAKEDYSRAVDPNNFTYSVQFTDFGQNNEIKVKKALELIKKIVASDEFKKGVIEKIYKGKRTYVDNRGLTNEQIYHKILLAAEQLGNQEKNSSMDLDLQTYFEDTPTIGYTYPNIQRIYMNRKYLEKFNIHQVADNLFHEWLHKIGFDHAVKRTSDRAHSVPYAIGYLVRDLAQKFIE